MSGARGRRPDGHKLHGAYLLQRTRKVGNHQPWLLIKRRGPGADARRNPFSTEPESVLSGRTVEEVAADAAGDGLSDDGRDA